MPGKGCSWKNKKINKKLIGKQKCQKSDTKSQLFQLQIWGHSFSKKTREFKIQQRDGVSIREISLLLLNDLRPETHNMCPCFVNNIIKQAGIIHG